MPVAAASIPGIPRAPLQPTPGSGSEAGESGGICGQVGLGVVNPTCVAKGPSPRQEKEFPQESRVPERARLPALLSGMNKTGCAKAKVRL